MLFNSVHFLIFFPVVTVLYFLAPHRVRWLLLLAASVYFYMVFKPVYILILVFTILVDYAAGRLIEGGGSRRRMWLIASILANTGSLAFFKYYNFLNDPLRRLFGTVQLHDPIPFLNIILPIGLSFHVFQSLSYTIEVYRRHQVAERHLGIFALYVMFYPQLVAGPIERPQHLLHQFREHHVFEYDRVLAGLQLMLWGMIKKVMIADRLAPFVNEVYDHPVDYRALSYIVATIFFAFQIYCDFSGYSDIALGAAQVMGFKLMTNFNRPYFSHSIAEFWKRWHISLSTWFRDYLYISMGGNRVSPPRWYFNLFFTFLVSGLWHGANWTYLIWGAINGVYLILEILVRKALHPFHRWNRFASERASLLRPFQVVLTFALSCFAWIFFRAKTISEATAIVRGIFGLHNHLWSDLVTAIHNLSFAHTYIFMQQGEFESKLAVAVIGLLLLVDFTQERTRGLRARINAQPAWARWALYYAAVFSLIFFGALSRSQQFIYFQF